MLLVNHLTKHPIPWETPVVSRAGHSLLQMTMEVVATTAQLVHSLPSKAVQGALSNLHKGAMWASCGPDD